MKRGAPLLAEFARSGDFRQREIAVPLVRDLCFYALSWRVRILVVQPPISPLALLILSDPLKQMHATKIRPQSRRHIDLGVSDLPEEEKSTGDRRLEWIVSSRS